MAYRPGGDDDAAHAAARGRPGLPVLRHDRDRPGRGVAAPGRDGRRRSSRRRCSRCWAPRSATRSRSARRASSVRATVVNVPGDVGLRSAFGPRVYIPRSRVAETGLLTRGSRARYEAYLRFPPGTDPQKLADRFRPALSAERMAVRTVSEDQRQLTETLTRFGNFLGPRRARRAAARRPRRRERRPRLHQAPDGDDRRAALPRGELRHGAARLSRPGGRRRPRSAAWRGRCSAPSPSSRCPACCAACFRWTSRGRSRGPPCSPASASACGWRSSSRCSRSSASAACRRSACCGATSRRSGRAATRRASRPCSRSRRAWWRWR